MHSIPEGEMNRDPIILLLTHSLETSLQKLQGIEIHCMHAERPWTVHDITCMKYSEVPTKCLLFNRSSCLT